MFRQLIARVVLAARQRRTAVIATTALVALVSVEGVRRLSFDTDVLSLLPRSGRVTAAFRDYLAHFGSLDQLYVVFTAPGDRGIDEYRDQIEDWIAELRHAAEIARVDAGLADDTRDFDWLAERQLLLLGDSALGEALARLQPDGIARAVGETRELLTVPSADVVDLVRQDPLGLLSLLRDTLGATQVGLNIGGGRDGYVTPDGRRRLVMARPAKPPYDTEFSRALDGRLREIAARVSADPAVEDGADVLPPMHVDFAGGHRVAVETEAVVKRESIVNGVGSLALILPLLFLVFRSGWLVLVGPLPAALSLLVVLGVLGFAGTRLSAAGTGAAAMLFGLGIDGVVLLYVAYLLLYRDGDRADTSEGLAGPTTSMLIGMWTTAATFYGLAFVDFPPMQQLGLLVGHSMLICSVLTMILVPALLPRRPPAAAQRPSLTMPVFAGWIRTHRSAVAIAAALVTVVLGAASLRLRIDPTLDRLRSVTDAARLEIETANAFGLPTDVYVVLAQGPALEALLANTEHLVARLDVELPDLAVEAPTRLLPSLSTQTERTARIQAAGLSSDAVRTFLERARIDAGFREDSFAPFAARVDRLLDINQRLTYDGYVEHGFGDLMQRFVVRDGARWLLATYAFPRSAEQAARLQAIISDVGGGQTLTGLPLVNQELARGFVRQFVTGLGIGAAFVILLIVVAFRKVRPSVFALLPTVLGLIWTAGLLALAGVELDLFAVFGVMTLLGIGVDYGVHLVHRWSERGDATQATAELAPVILAAGAITILGYGTLGASSYPPLRSIGVVSLVGVAALVAAALVVLPALLADRPS